MSIWAGIKYAINSTLGTDKFLPLDKQLVDASEFLYTEEFKTAGTWTVNVPKDAKRVIITACAGGGGGGNGNTSGSNDYGGSGGGGGGFVVNAIYNVPAGKTSLSITVGAGGSNGSPGKDGGATIIDNIVTLTGGTGGATLGGTVSAGGVPNGGDGGKRGTAGNPTRFGRGGYAGGTTTNTGGGGGASLGAGGDGGALSLAKKEPSEGGGGGGGYYNTTQPGQSGADGYVKLGWLL